MAEYPIVGDSLIYNRTTFNTAYLDKTEIDINNSKTKSDSGTDGIIISDEI